MRSALFPAVAAAVWMAACAHRPPSVVNVVPDAPASLVEVVNAQISAPSLEHALWGILIEEEDGTRLYERNAAVLMIPASNRKLFISALAGECGNGFDSQISTTVSHDGVIENGVLRGNLVIKGSGDPSLGGRYYNSRDTQLKPLTDALRRRGIREISGGVVADVSFFAGDILPSSWKQGNLGSSYSAPVDALAFNENVAGIFIDPNETCTNVVSYADPAFVPVKGSIPCVTGAEFNAHSDESNQFALAGAADGTKAQVDVFAVDDPALYAAQAVDDLVRRSGVKISLPPSVSRSALQTTETLAELRSPFLFQLLSTVLKNSQNLYAEMIFKRSATTGPAISFDDATEGEVQFLTGQLGIPRSEYSFADGSGLSSENLVTPSATVRVLRYMGDPARRGIYWAILATPGEEGTLRLRLPGLEHRMRGKTGSIEGVNALSGMLLGRKGAIRYFSIFANHHTASTREALAAIDAIVQKAADF